jgi:hypothetical protein
MIPLAGAGMFKPTPTIVEQIVLDVDLVFHTIAFALDDHGFSMMQ